MIAGSSDGASEAPGSAAHRLAAPAWLSGIKWRPPERVRLRVTDWQPVGCRPHSSAPEPVSACAHGSADDSVRPIIIQISWLVGRFDHPF